MRNTNGLIGRYPGADGMKTGFICSAGFNVVASATRDGRRLITVVHRRPFGERADDQGGGPVRARLRLASLGIFNPSLDGLAASACRARRTCAR